MSALKNIQGQVFGRLTVISRLANDKKSRARWRRLCACKDKRLISVAGKDLRSGHVKSCGCLQQEWADIGQRKPGVAFRQIFKNYQCRAHNRKTPFALSRDEFYEITQKPCHYCGRSLTNSYQEKAEIFLYNGVDRVECRDGYVPGNVVSCCSICNTMKMSLPLDVFREHVKLVYEHFIKPQNSLVNEWLQAIDDSNGFISTTGCKI